MFFSATEFKKNASRIERQAVPEPHLFILDGMEAMPPDSGYKFGTIDYEANGQEWELYPVMPEWCVNGKQIKMEL